MQSFLKYIYKKHNLKIFFKKKNSSYKAVFKDPTYYHLQTHKERPKS